MNASAVETAKRLLKSAAKAVDDLEAAVRELVAMRAWEVLGYENFSEMWLAENGFKCPRIVKVMALVSLYPERNSRTPQDTRAMGPNGLTLAECASLIGVSNEYASHIFNETADGVPVPEINPFSRRKSLRETRLGPGIDLKARPTPRRAGRTYDELVSESFMLARREATLVEDIARKADVPKAEIYRQAVAEYLMRHHESKGGAS